MSGGHGHDDHGHGGGGGGSNAIGECLFGYCNETKGAAHGLAGMFYETFLGIFGSSSGGGGHHDHGHH